MNTRKNYCKLYLIIIFMFSFSFSYTQNNEDTLTYFIETTDGNSYIGNIIKQDSVKILFYYDKLGEISINKAHIKKIHLLNINKIKDDKYWFDNPQSTRYFFSPNAYGLEAGEGYYQNVWVMANSFAVGITDNISFGGGVVPLFLFAGAETPIWLTPKVSIPINEGKFNLGAGALLGTIIGEEESGFGILYGISTFGSRDNNLSVGIGYGYADGDWTDLPMININAMVRTGARGYLVTENYFISTGETTLLLLSVGGRQIIKNSGLDYGLIIPFEESMEELIAIPWLGITVPFGKK